MVIRPKIALRCLLKLKCIAPHNVTARIRPEHAEASHSESGGGLLGARPRRSGPA